MRVGSRYFVDLASLHVPHTIGAKAANLRWLKRQNLLVPRTYVITWDAYQDYLADRPEIIPRLQHDLEGLIRPGRKYAIRSSANLEDSRVSSFAGQFKTILNAGSLEEILTAVWAIWATTQRIDVQTYCTQLNSGKQGVQPLNDSLKMAVIVQEMVEACLSGVAFSRNPVTALDEIVVEAVTGLGTRLVQEGVTPLRWTSKWGEWSEQPDDSLVPLQVIQQVVDGTELVTRRLGKDVDLEWAFDGQRVYWLQMRPITSLDGARVYTNKLSREMLPGKIRPLLLSTVVPLKVRQVTSLLERLSGETLAEPERLVKSFYGHVYFEMNTFGRVFKKLGLPRDALEVMFGIHPAPVGRKAMQMRPQMLRHTLRLLRLLIDEWRFALRFEHDYPSMLESYRALHALPLDDLDESQLLTHVNDLAEMHQFAIHANMVTPVFLLLFNAVLKNRLRRRGIDFEQLDLTADMDQLAAYQPHKSLAVLHGRFEELPLEVQAQVRQAGYSGLQAIPAAAEFARGLDDFLQQFGHFSDSGNDFTHPLWSETPELIFDLAIQPGTARSEPAGRMRLSDLKLRQQDWVLKLILGRARHYMLQREKSSSLYTYSIAAYRRLYQTLGGLLNRRGLLEMPEDIFDLFDAEVHQAVRDPAASSLSGLVAFRKQEMAQIPSVPLPTVIFGDDPPPLYPCDGRCLKGTPTARGRYTGPARPIRSLSEFDRLQTGDVLIIPYSDVGWAPLFARAGAVVAESGGILSHSSIIAREYGIPAVVSVSGALQIRNGASVSVDGYKGEVQVIED